MAEVILENVCKVFAGNVKAVDDVSLAIADREFIVLVGPSGCGKSTTLRMVAGLEDISAGTIRIGDRVVNNIAPKDRNIAMVFQNYALYPHMTVYKNMAFGLMLRRQHGFWDNLLWALFAPGKFRAARAERRQIDQKVRDAAKMLGIENLLERRPKALSGGQRQRVAVGRAIVREPKAYLFDEPLSNLDAKLRIEMRAEIKKLHRRVQTTTIYVTHDQEEAMTLGDRVVVMKDGLVQQVATPFEVYERPVNRFVAGFVGTPPMNFLEGRLLQENGRLYFDEGDNRLPVADVHRARLESRTDGPIVVGVRPEMLSPAGNSSSGAVLKARVAVVEPLGDRMDVHVGTSRHPHITCRVDARQTIREGESTTFAVEMDRVHFFEPGPMGRNITLG
ncbi:MAG: ATP-binding cassette domain-containing protein [Planctomycetes bacterium]|nr:ATP-binding cassette domain-containing protein [Planctomycetota bacterium]